MITSSPSELNLFPTYFGEFEDRFNSKNDEE